MDPMQTRQSSNFNGSLAALGQLGEGPVPGPRGELTVSVSTWLGLSIYRPPIFFENLISCIGMAPYRRLVHFKILR